MNASLYCNSYVNNSFSFEISLWKFVATFELLTYKYRPAGQTGSTTVTTQSNFFDALCIIITALWVIIHRAVIIIHRASKKIDWAVPFLILQITQKLEELQTCEYLENMQLKANYLLYIFKSTGISCSARYFNIYE